MVLSFSNYDEDRVPGRPWEIEISTVRGGLVNDCFYLAAEFEARCADKFGIKLFGIDMSRFSDEYPDDKYSIHAYRIRFNDNSDIGVFIAGSDEWKKDLNTYRVNSGKRFERKLISDVKKCIGETDYKTSGRSGLLIIRSRKQLDEVIERLYAHADFCNEFWLSDGNMDSIKSKGLKEQFEFTGNPDKRIMSHAEYEELEKSETVRN